MVSTKMACFYSPVQKRGKPAFHLDEFLTKGSITTFCDLHTLRESPSAHGRLITSEKHLQPYTAASQNGSCSLFANWQLSRVYIRDRFPQYVESALAIGKALNNKRGSRCRKAEGPSIFRWSSLLVHGCRKGLGPFEGRRLKLVVATTHSIPIDGILKNAAFLCAIGPAVRLPKSVLHGPAG